MDPVSLLTILGLVIAVYEIIPPERRLDFRLRLNWLDWTIIALSILSIHYILFFPVLSNLGVALDLGYWRWGFDPSNTSYLIILVASIIVVIRSQRAPLRRSKTEVFRQLTERLLQEGKYSDLIFLLQHHHKGLFRIYNADFFLPRLRHKISPRMDYLINILGEGEILKPRPNVATRVTTFLISIGSRIAPLLPTRQASTRIAEDIVRRVFLAEDFVAHTARTRPHFSLDLLRYEFREREEFLQLYVRSLLAYRFSILFFEIRNNQNVSSGHRYTIDDRNRFITFFLKDAKVAETLGIWKPFGDYAIDYLDILARDPANDSYNGPLDNYHEESRWHCPIHTTLRFFDIMIPEALHQGIQWHMWLFYLPHIASKIIRNLSPQSNVELDREWPTPYHCLLYEIVSALGDWIEAVEDVPIDQPNVKLNNNRVDHENGNIPKSAILAMGQVLHYVIKSDSLDMKFRSYLLEIALCSVRDLSRADNTRPFGDLLQRSILLGGHPFRSDDKSFLTNLNVAFFNLDYVLRSELKEFEQALQAELLK
jgi:hypothetical protein